MTFLKLQFVPGINRDLTNYSGENGWWDCDKIRFNSGFPQKIGGWEKYTPATVIGVCRQMWNWVTTYGDNLMALPTNQKVHLEFGGNIFNITPLRAVDPTLSSPGTDNCVATVSGSTTVTFNLTTAHAATTGNWVTISGVTGNVGGVPDAQINGDHKITVVDTDSFSIEVADPAPSTAATGGGTAISISFEIDVGFAINTLGTGWGAGTWSRDRWGLGAVNGGIFLQQQDWWASNFDNDLVLNVRNGGAYWWTRGTTVDPNPSLTTRAISLPAYATSQGYTSTAVPVKVGQLLVSQQDKHLIAFGSVPFGSTNPDDFDPLLVRWSDQDNPGQWTPQDINSAGDIRLSRGSRIVRALPTRQEILIFTDSNLYTMQFLGTTDVFGFQEYSDNISIASPRAVITASDITYWMGKDKFYAYTGRVETLDCPISDYIFDDFNLLQQDQVVCGTNERWSEVWWFYASADSNWNNRYAIFNYQEQVWYYGSLERTAWLDTALREYPQALNTTDPENNETGYIYDHEASLNDDGAPMVSFIQSNDFDLDNGDQFMITKRILPDVDFNTSAVEQPQVTFETLRRNFPGSPITDDAEDDVVVVRTTVDSYTRQIFVRVRARQVAVKVKSEDIDVFWRLGTPRLDVRPSGRR
jgi:hypothetical protein